VEYNVLRRYLSVSPTFFYHAEESIEVTEIIVRHLEIKGGYERIRKEKSAIDIKMIFPELWACTLILMIPNVW
jgi:hypothetical protein